jgi:hypothetical protein
MTGLAAVAEPLYSFFPAPINTLRSLSGWTRAKRPLTASLQENNFVGLGNNLFVHDRLRRVRFRLGQ